MRTALKAGIIGCGNISDRYFEAGARFQDFDVVACADLQKARATAKSKIFAGVTPLTVDQLLNREDLDLIINLTIPVAHTEVALKALKAEMHVYSEKPLALNTADGEVILALAKKNKRRVGSAPDTFLGAGIQTARKLLDDNWIGQPVAGTAFMQCHGHETWHPDPDFYYQPGAGPLFDMGPYYLTALVNLLGPVRQVCAYTSKAFDERLITSEAKYGTKITVNVPTHTAGTLAFTSGALITLVMSFDVWRHSMPHLELHGTTGSMRVPDPNTFGGEVRIARAASTDWSPVPHSHTYPTEARGIGIADMAAAISRNEEHRASGALAYHVLEVMEALHTAAAEQRYVDIQSQPERPEPMEMNLGEGQVRAVRTVQG